MEYLLGAAHHPERLFDGRADVLRRVEYQRDLLAFRLALMEERLRILLGEFTEPRGTPKRLQFEWHTTDPTRVWYTVDRAVTLTLLGGTPAMIEAQRRISIKLLPRNAVGYSAFAATDFASNWEDNPEFVAVTRDFSTSGLPLPRKSGAPGVIELFDTLEDLDREIQLRLAQAESPRGELSERHD